MNKNGWRSDTNRNKAQEAVIAELADILKIEAQKNAETRTPITEISRSLNEGSKGTYFLPAENAWIY